MTSLKQKTITGILWSAIDSFSAQGITFIVGLVLARLLTPAEFGLIGMLTIFISLSESFINSGFSSALIRKKNCSQNDYATVFYFNVVAGLLFFLILFFSAPLISSFFKEPKLEQLVRVLGIVLIIDSFTIIHRTSLIKRVDFKFQTKISLISAVGSGAVGIGMAYSGFGVWSLVFKTLSQQALSSILLWVLNRWRPIGRFSKDSFKELFAFGYRLLLSGLIETLYRNIYSLIIGKYFSAKELGYYTRAQMFNELPSKNLNGIMSRVTYPVLAELQDDKIMLKAAYKRMIKSIMYISMVLMAGLAAVAEPMLITLIGEQWRPAIIYLQLLAFPGMMYPLHSLNLNILKVQGRSDLFLRLEIIKKVLAIPIIVIGIFFGIKIMILGMWVNTLIAYYLNSYWSGSYINYSMKEQVKDILPGLAVSLVMGTTVMIIGFLLPTSYLVKLLVQLATGTLITFVLSEVFKPEAYLELKRIAIENVRDRFTSNVKIIK